MFRANRAMFSSLDFAEKFKMGDLHFGNFYQAQYDSYVDVLHAQFSHGHLWFGSPINNSKRCRIGSVLSVFLIWSRYVQNIFDFVDISEGLQWNDHVIDKRICIQNLML